jgi:imidazole glycerol-phosphate synthase subunit HisF
MLRPRIIPCLLVHEGGLVKTIGFKNPKYVGDPINAVKIFNEKEADELMVLDIDATRDGREPDYKLIAHLAAECRMPLCYGGGVITVQQARKIIGLGVEKVAISAAAACRPELITEVSQAVGSQSVVVVIDVKRKAFSSKYEVFTHNGTKKTGLLFDDFCVEMQRRGAGELVINSIDNDGTMKGYDLALVDRVREVVKIPMTVLGGAGALSDMEILLRRFGIIGAAAGSLFVFKGAYKAVLINYPNQEEKDRLIDRASATADSP